MRQLSTKASNSRCKCNFGNITVRILILQTTWFSRYLHDCGSESRTFFGIPSLQTIWFSTDRIMHCSNEKSTYGNVSIPILSPCQVKNNYGIWNGPIRRTAPSHVKSNHGKITAGNSQAEQKVKSIDITWWLISPKLWVTWNYGKVGYTCVYIYIYRWTYTYLYRYRYGYIYIYIHTLIYIYIHIFIYIYTCKFFFSIYYCTWKHFNALCFNFHRGHDPGPGATGDVS